MTTLPGFIASLLASNLNVVHMHVDDLIQEESLVVPPQGGNTLNWVLGHVAHFRGVMLAYVGLTAPWPQERYAHLGFGSEPITDAASAIDLATVVRDLDAAQEMLAEWAADVSDEALAFKKEGARRDVGGQMGWWAWHEAYHIGQLEQLRHVAGRHEALI